VAVHDLEANKAIVRRHLEEAVNGHRPELWDEIMAEDFVMHNPYALPGRAGYREMISMMWNAFPDLSVELLDVVAEDDRVVVRYVDTGTHLGEMLGNPPTGRRYTKHGFAMFRIASGRLAETWLQEDDLGYYQQLGFPLGGESATAS
jgi:steroid delta-isomerase-like uncharacterized protein